MLWPILFIMVLAAIALFVVYYIKFYAPEKVDKQAKNKILKNTHLWLRVQDWSGKEVDECLVVSNNGLVPYMGKTLWISDANIKPATKDVEVPVNPDKENGPTIKKTVPIAYWRQGNWMLAFTDVDKEIIPDGEKGTYQPAEKDLGSYSMPKLKCPECDDIVDYTRDAVEKHCNDKHSGKENSVVMANPTESDIHDIDTRGIKVMRDGKTCYFNPIRKAMGANGENNFAPATIRAYSGEAAKDIGGNDQSLKIGRMQGRVRSRPMIIASPTMMAMAFVAIYTLNPILTILGMTIGMFIIMASFVMAGHTEDALEAKYKGEI